MSQLVSTGFIAASAANLTSASAISAASYQRQYASSDLAIMPVQEKHPAFIAGEQLLRLAGAVKGFLQTTVDMAFSPFMLPVAEAATTPPRDASTYRTPQEKLFVACKTGCDVALTVRGLEKLNPELGKDDSFPIFPIHIEDLARIKQNNDFASFKALMKKGLKHIEKEFDKSGRLQTIIANEYHKLDGTPNLSNENLISNISKKLSELFKVKETVVTKKIGTAITIAAQKIRKTNVLDILISDSFYHLLKEELFLPKIKRLGSDESLKKLFERAGSFTHDPEEIERLQSQYRTAEETALEHEPYDDRMVKTKLMAEDKLPAIIIDRAQLPDLPRPPSARMRNGGYHIDHYIGKKGTAYYKENSVTHEPLHHYEDRLCLYETTNPTTSVNHPRTNEFKGPCGNNVEKHPQLPKKISAAFLSDYNKFKKFMQEPDKIRKQKGYFAIDDFKRVSTKYRYPQIPDEEVSNVTGRIHTAFDQTFELCNSSRNPIEVIPNITQDLNPRELLEYAPNTAYIRSFTIHDDGRDETRLYMNLLQGNREAVRALVQKDPAILDKTYDGIKLVDVARMVRRYDKVVADEVRLTDKTPNQYRNMVKWVEKEYAKPRSQEREL